MTGLARRHPASEKIVAAAASAAGDSPRCAPLQRPEAAVIVNADDWGRDVFTTDRILECVRAGVVSSASAMVFMQDSERATELARAQGVDAGLHLNLTLEFSASACPAALKEHQADVRRFLLSSRFASLVYDHRLARSFEYLVRAQTEEYERLYGIAPRRVDGHHHMHLCANVLRGKLLPAGAIVRRNFSFRPGEKSALNRAYRGWRDRQLAQRHQLADYFFDLLPLRPPQRLERIFALGAKANVEIETHPANYEEYRFLRAGEFERYAGRVSVMRGYVLRSFRLEESSFAPGKSRFGAAAKDGNKA